jgi:antitoxin (DNA-binding transcriptional repressor) of toxin-antitoxin stability system
MTPKSPEWRQFSNDRQTGQPEFIQVEGSNEPSKPMLRSNGDPIARVAGDQHQEPTSMTIVDVNDAMLQLPKLIERVEAGEEIVIARQGQPVARLSSDQSKVECATPPSGRRVGGQLRGEMWVSPDFEAPYPDEIAKAFGMLDE